MSVKHGRIEARHVVPTGGYSATFDDGTTSTPVTVPAGNYYVSGASGIIAYLQSALAGWTFTVDDGEGGTGRVTIANGGVITVTWTDTELRDILGFTGNLSSASSPQTGTRCHKGLWLPGVPMTTPHGVDTAAGVQADCVAATWVSTLRQTIGPTGAVDAIAGSKFPEYRGIRWEGVTRAKAKMVGETSLQESFERWWLDTQLAGQEYFVAGSRFRLFWDADDDTKYSIVKLVGLDEFEPRKLVETWTGRYMVELPRLVVVP